MKKTFCILLVVMVIGFCVTGCNNSKDNNDNNSNEGDNTGEVKKDEGVIDIDVVLERFKDLEHWGNRFDNIEFAEKITRAEFIKLLCDLIETDDFSTGMVTKTFIDVPEDYWANQYIAYTEELGIIDSIPNSEFKPDTPLIFDDFVKWIVRANYDEEKAKNAGGTFEAYYTVANELGFLKRISYSKGDEVNHSAVIMFTYNFINLWE